MFNALKAFILDVIFPLSCAGCGINGVLLCETCSAALRPNAPQCFICNARDIEAKICASCRKHTEYARMYAPFSYSNKTIRAMIHRLKYRRIQPYAAITASLLQKSAAFYKLALPRNTVIVAVPLHPSRFLERGFNQSEHIGQELSQRLAIPLADRDVLVRHKRTKPQAQIKNPEERRENIKDAFRVRDATDIFRKNVLLIDDVATTGETLNEAAKALKRGGAKSVWAFTLAK